MIHQCPKCRVVLDPVEGVEELTCSDCGYTGERWEFEDPGNPYTVIGLYPDYLEYSADLRYRSFCHFVRADSPSQAAEVTIRELTNEDKEFDETAAWEIIAVLEGSQNDAYEGPGTRRLKE